MPLIFCSTGIQTIRFSGSLRTALRIHGASKTFPENPPRIFRGLGERFCSFKVAYLTMNGAVFALVSTTFVEKWQSMNLDYLLLEKWSRRVFGKRKVEGCSVFSVGTLYFFSFLRWCN